MPFTWSFSIHFPSNRLAERNENSNIKFCCLLLAITKVTLIYEQWAFEHEHIRHTYSVHVAYRQARLSYIENEEAAVDALCMCVVSRVANVACLSCVFLTLVEPAVNGFSALLPFRTVSSTRIRTKLVYARKVYGVQFQLTIRKSVFLPRFNANSFLWKFKNRKILWRTNRSSTSNPLSRPKPIFFNLFGDFPSL